METLKQITERRFKRNGVAENTYKGEFFQADLTEYRDDFLSTFFGSAITQKEINFFELSRATYNPEGSTVKGYLVKPAGAMSYADAVSFEFYSNFVGSDRTTVKKTTPNAQTESSTSQTANANKVAQGLRTVEQSLRLLFEYQKVEIHAQITTLTDVITFADYQLLEVGEFVTINETSYEVLAETTFGLGYQLDAAPGVQTKASYLHNFDRNSAPLVSPFRGRGFPG